MPCIPVQLLQLSILFSVHSADKKWLDGQSVTSNGKVYSRGKERLATECLAKRKSMNLAQKVESAVAQSVKNDHTEKLLHLCKGAASTSSTNTGKSTDKPIKTSQNNSTVDINAKPPEKVRRKNKESLNLDEESTSACQNEQESKANDDLPQESSENITKTAAVCSCSSFPSGKLSEKIDEKWFTRYLHYL